MISKIDFNARHLTSNAEIFLLLENAKSNGIFDLIEKDLVFEKDSTNKIKMNHIKTMLCGHFIGMDKLERLKLLQNDPLVNEFDISVKEPKTVSRFLGNFTFKTTQHFRDINFKVFSKQKQLQRKMFRNNNLAMRRMMAGFLLSAASRMFLTATKYLIKTMVLSTDEKGERFVGIMKLNKIA